MYFVLNATEQHLYFFENEKVSIGNMIRSREFLFLHLNGHYIKKICWLNILLLLNGEVLHLPRI